MIVHYIFRKAEPHFHSIEGVFRSTVSLVGRHCDVKNSTLSHPAGSPRGIFKNLKEFGPRQPDTVYHITGDVNYMALKTGRRTVLTIHDMQPALEGNLFARAIRLILLFWIPALIVRRITVISEFSGSELRRLVPFVRRKIRAIPNPVHPDFEYHPVPCYGSGEGKHPGPPAGKTSEPPCRVLLIGTRPHKNLERTLEALKGLPVTLTIVGSLSHRQRAILDSVKLEYENLVNLPRKKLVQCYRETDLLCFASLYEGFGMPIVEAQATGRPVITSNLGAMKDVAGHGALLVDPEDVASIRKGAEIFLANPVYRKQLVQRGLENIQRFRAAEIAEKYMEVYREVNGNKKRIKN